MSDSEDCLPDEAKVQIVDSMTQWSNKRREKLARMKADGKVDPSWIEAHEGVLKSVEETTSRIMNAKDCPDVTA